MSVTGFLGARAPKIRANPGRAAAAGPRLTLVPPRPETAPIARFLVAVFVVLALGLLGLLFLNTVLAQDAYRAHDLQRSGLILGDQEQALLRQVDALNDAAALAARATALGMIPGKDPRFLLADGQLLGAALPSGQPDPRLGSANADGLIVVGTPIPLAPVPVATPQPGVGTQPGPKPSPTSASTPKPTAQPTVKSTPVPTPKPTSGR